VAREGFREAEPTFLTHLTAEARGKPAFTSLRLLAALNALFKYAPAGTALPTPPLNPFLLRCLNPHFQFDSDISTFQRP